MHSKHTRGQALVEFALITPLLILLTALIFDFGRILFAYSMSSNALRNALRNAQIIGYEGTDTIYANCGLFREHIRKASFVSTPTITIRYQRASDGSFIECPDGVDAIDPNELENGDMLQIDVANKINLITPFVNSVLPYL